MAYHRRSSMEKWEVIERWHRGQAIAGIAKALGYDRKTVRGYIRQAIRHGLRRDAALPSREEIVDLFTAEERTGGRGASSINRLSEHLDELKGLIDPDDSNQALKPKLAFEVLIERHGLEGKVSYSSFKRFVKRNLVSLHPRMSTCRLEASPGREVQIDYAKVGVLYDPIEKRKRTLMVFIGTLSFSRHKYAELVFRQDQKSFTGSHVRMFDYFGAVPERVVLDNLKAGVIKPDLYDPSLNRSYRELATHYGCFLDPCRVVHPKDKGKVERDVQTIRQAVRKLMVLNPEADIVELNRLLRRWCMEEYGNRKHGTTNDAPWRLFAEIERPVMSALPFEAFEAADWKKATVHPDHYVQFKRKAYSVPHPYVGRTVWVRGTERLVQIYHDDTLIKQHVVTSSYRHTDYADFPHNVRSVLEEGLPAALLARSLVIGPHFYSMIESLLSIHAFINLRKAQGLLALADQFDRPLIEKAASFTMELGLTVTPKLFRTLIEKLVDQEAQRSTVPISQESFEFVRDIEYFISRQEVLQ